MLLQSTRGRGGREWGLSRGASSCGGSRRASAAVGATDDQVPLANDAWRARGALSLPWSEQSSSVQEREGEKAAEMGRAGATARHGADAGTRRGGWVGFRQWAENEAATR
jgi:hypothetical protein